MGRRRRRDPGQWRPVLLDRRVDGLSYDAATKLWTVSARRGDGSRETFTARNVVSSAPIRELVGAIRRRP